MVASKYHNMLRPFLSYILREFCSCRCDGAQCFLLRLKSMRTYYIWFTN